MTDSGDICKVCNLRFEFSCCEYDFCHCKACILQFGCPIEQDMDQDNDMPDLE